MNILLKLFAAGLIVTLAACHSATNEKKIGIIIPIEHQAMNEIVSGFSETLRALSPYPLKIKAANAQGDINLERAIIQQMKNEGYDVITPIGTDASQMSAAATRNQPIVSLAASLTEQDRALRKPCNIAIVHDEISADDLLRFIHLVYPDIKNLTLVHSASDKVFPEVTAAQAAAKQYGIQINALLVPSLNELYSTTSNIPANTQGILVLKDSLIVSGINTLEMSAQQRHIPLITSDQGSVQDGAAFALGVHEREIGVAGAKLAAAILSGKPACSLPIVDVSRLTVFVNKKSLEKEQQSLAAVQSAAENAHYQIEYVASTKGA
jgi:putative ABC transport system substrate-binding protein